MRGLSEPHQSLNRIVPTSCAFLVKVYGTADGAPRELYNIL